MNAFAALQINTFEELKEHVQFVIDHPDIAGFDAMLLREHHDWPERKPWALNLLAKGFRLNLEVHEAESDDTHLAVRLVVIPPVKLEQLQ